MASFSIDANNNIYILDSGNFRVTKWAPNAAVGTIIAGGNGNGAASNQIQTAYGMFLEPNTLAIWIADTWNHRIVRWISPNASTVVCGSYGSGATQFNNPFGIFVDTSSSNTFYVADTLNHRIQMWPAGANQDVTVAGQTGISGAGLTQLNHPAAVIMEREGILYIVEESNHRIVRWIIGAISGEIVAGDLTTGVLPNQLRFPFNVRFDSTGALIVADRANNRIQRFQISCGKYQRSRNNSWHTFKKYFR